MRILTRVLAEARNIPAWLKLKSVKVDQSLAAPAADVLTKIELGKAALKSLEDKVDQTELLTVQEELGCHAVRSLCVRPLETEGFT